MKLDLKDRDDVQKIRDSIFSSYKKMSPFREKRYELVREYAGYHYGNDEQAHTEDRVPTNLIELAVSIYLRQLVPHRPQASITTPHRQLNSKANSLELATNMLLKRMRFAEDFGMAVKDALFMMGVMRQGISHSEDNDAGEIYSDYVDFDDLIIDMSAKRVRDLTYIGNYYFIEEEAFKESKNLSAKDRRAIKGDDRNWRTEDSEDEVSSLSRGSEGVADQLRKVIRVADVYLPSMRTIITIPLQAGFPVLWTSDWDRGRFGPYRILSFASIPGNILPLSPAMTWLDLHSLANELFRKGWRQSLDQKTVMEAEKAGVKDAERVTRAGDREVVLVDRVGRIQAHNFPGADPQTIAGYLQAKNEFNWFAGNLDAIGGLGAASDTVGQERLITANASARLADMQEIAYEFLSDVIGDVAWFLWTDPVTEYQITKKIPGTNLKLPTVFTPEDREGDLADYEIEVDPYSATNQTPGQRLQSLMQTAMQVILPLRAELAQQGMMVDVAALVRKIGELSQSNDLDDILVTTTNDPQDLMQRMAGEQATKPNETTRRYERISRPGASRAGQDKAMEQMLRGGNPQPGELASVAR